MRLSRTTGMLTGVLWMSVVPAGLAQVWLPDRDGDGHPLFGETAQRPDGEPSAPGSLLGGAPLYLVFADVTGDGHLDAVLALSAGGNANVPSAVSILTNSGDGVFAPPVMYLWNKSFETVSLAVADFDGDGDLDIATANARANTASILLNNGDGTFDDSGALHYPVGSQPRSVRTTDLNGDGRPDLVVMNCLSDDVSVLLNKGDGSFAPEKRVFVGGLTQRGDPNLNFPYPGPHMAVGDVNGDGAADVAVPAKTQVKILLNDGAGGFSLAPAHPKVAAPDAYAVVVADLDGDGLADVAAVSTKVPSQGLSVALNLGGGLFAPPVAYNLVLKGFEGSFYFHNALAAADIDGNGAADLVIGHEILRHYTLAWNNGDGTFTIDWRRAHTRPWSVAAGDVNGDGWPDVAIANGDQRSVLRVTLNDGAGGLLEPATTPPFPDDVWDAGFHRLAAADLDLDGRPDLAVSGKGPTIIDILRNDGAGGFEFMPPVVVGPGASWGEFIAVADLNADGLPDLIAADSVVDGGFTDPGRIWTTLNAGGMSFQDPVSYDLADSFPVDLVVEDFNGDGAPDVAAMTNQLYLGEGVPRERRILLLFNDGSGALSWGPTYIVATEVFAPPSTSFAAADADGDGDPDLLVLSGAMDGPGKLTVLLNDGAGKFSLGPAVELARQPRSIAAVDIDGDGAIDAIVSHRHTWGVYFDKELLLKPYLTILRNTGQGAFEIAAEYISPLHLSEDHAVVAEFAGPGRLGIAIPMGGEFVTVHNHTGGFTFDAVASYSVRGGGLPTGLAAADFDLDGRLDLAAVMLAYDFVNILYNVARPACPADCDGSGGLTLFDFFCFVNAFNAGTPGADCDGNGSLNLFDFLCFANAFNAGC